MRRREPSVALPTSGGEYEQQPDGTFTPTGVERERRAQAEAEERKRSAPPRLNNDDEDDGA
jgi:hypothetical protein